MPQIPLQAGRPIASVFYDVQPPVERGKQKVKLKKKKRLFSKHKWKQFAEKGLKKEKLGMGFLFLMLSILFWVGFFVLLFLWTAGVIVLASGLFGVISAIQALFLILFLVFLLAASIVFAILSVAYFKKNKEYELLGKELGKKRIGPKNWELFPKNEKQIPKYYYLY